MDVTVKYFSYYVAYTGCRDGKLTIASVEYKVTREIKTMRHMNTLAKDIATKYLDKGATAVILNCTPLDESDDEDIEFDFSPNITK